jgi:aldehyde dehydrogenase (NAD+)
MTVAATLSGGLLIGGDRITDSSGGTHAHIYPASGEPNSHVQLAGADEIDRAVASAWNAHREWMSLTVDRRRDLLIDLADAVHENLDELSRLNVHDYAVPIAFAGNAILLERFLRHFAGYVDKPHGTSTPVTGSFDVNLIEREPYGVVGVITPWNGSLVVTGSCVAPALAAGNAVVLKPSEVAPFATLRFGELCLEVGLPAGLVNVVPAGPEGGDALVRHPGIRKVHFTGGDATARKVVQSAAVNLTPVVYDTFLEKFVAVIEASAVGDPLNPQVVFGPVVSQTAADRILSVIDSAVSQRAGELVVGGKRLGGELSQGYYIEPTVFAGVDNSSALAQNETFGPVVSLIKFGDEAEAVRIANDSRYGLNAFVQTNDLNRAHWVARQLEAGSVWINTFSDISPQGPYGGYKQSGFGRTGGLEGLHEFLQVKNIRIGMR